MSPVLVLDRDGRLVAALGSPGGSAILGYNAKTLVALLAWKLPLQEAIELPNLIARGKDFFGEAAKFPPEVLEGLKARGVEVKPGAARNPACTAWCCTRTDGSKAPPTRAARARGSSRECAIRRHGDRDRLLALQQPEHGGPRREPVHRERQHVTGPAPLERATHRIQLRGLHRQRLRGQPGTQQCRAQDARHLARLAPTQVTLEFLDDYQCGRELRGGRGEPLDVTVVAVTGMAEHQAEPSADTAQ